MNPPTDWKERIPQFLKDLYYLEACWRDSNGEMGMQNAQTPEDMLTSFIESEISKAKREERERVINGAISKLGQYSWGPYDPIKTLIDYKNLASLEEDKEEV